MRTHIRLVVDDPGGKPVMRWRGRCTGDRAAVGRGLARAAFMHRLSTHLARLLGFDKVSQGLLTAPNASLDS